MGPQAFLPSEIRAWAEGMQVVMRPWEFSAIMDMDAARRRALAGEDEKPAQTEGPPMRRSVSAQNGAAVMAMIDGWGKVRDE